MACLVTTEASLELLRAFPLFRSASLETLSALAATAQTQKLSHGDCVWQEGDCPAQVYMLARGLVEIVRSGPNGDDVTLALFGPRECPGLFAAVEGRPFPAAARVISEDAELRYVPRQAFATAIDRDPALSRALGQVMNQHNSILREKVEVLTAGEVPQRLLTLFEVLGARFGDEGEDGALHIPIALTRRVIARLVGARVETVIRVLSRWEKEERVLTTKDGFVVGNLEAMRKAVTSELRHSD